MRLLHDLRAFHASLDPDALPPSREDVAEVLRSLAYRVRNDEALSHARRGRALSRVNDALAAVASGGKLPDAATLAAWRDLPAAMSAEQLLSGGFRVSRAAFSRRWDMPALAARSYHAAFQRIRPQVIAATGELFDARPSRLSLEEAHPVLSRWLEDVSTQYQVAAPTLAWDPAVFPAFGGGLYTMEDQLIRMSHVSVITLLHEYRHHLQHQGAPMAYPDIEEDARAWSLSLYYSTRPRLYARMARAGRFIGVDPAGADGTA